MPKKFSDLLICRWLTLRSCAKVFSLITFSFVLDKPVVKLEFQGATAFTLSFTLRLLSDDRSNSFLQYYTLRYRKDNGNGWIKEISNISPKTTTYQLTGLEPYTEYIVELFATNKHFTSDPSKVRARTAVYGEMYNYSWVGIL